MKASQVGLSTAARSAIVSVFVSALNTAENTGGLVTQVCNVAIKHTKGAAMGDADIKAVSADIASSKGWRGDAAKVRTSEVRTVLKAAHLLPDAITAYHSRNKTCTWHESMKLARLVNKGKSITQAVKLAMETNTGPKGTPEGRTAGALKAWFKAAPRKREAIINAASLLGLKLGVKLDA